MILLRVKLLLQRASMPLWCHKILVIKGCLPCQTHQSYPNIDNLMSFKKTWRGNSCAISSAFYQDKPLLFLVTTSLGHWRLSALRIVWSQLSEMLERYKYMGTMNRYTTIFSHIYCIFCLKWHKIAGNVAGNSCATSISQDKPLPL